eukprot:gb/GECG01012374.1/.p1 GENE.gb/GECG01012374.1/~~gb/GECG01012374.1/.p1  ORF type:complete len:1304 (+),score=180.70 gb/GECG01012374.1/:1-3912(+)
MYPFQQLNGRIPAGTGATSTAAMNSSSNNSSGYQNGGAPGQGNGAARWGGIVTPAGASGAGTNANGMGFVAMGRPQSATSTGNKQHRNANSTNPSQARKIAGSFYAGNSRDNANNLILSNTWNSAANSAADAPQYQGQHQGNTVHRQWVSSSGLKYSNPTFRAQPLYNGVGRYDATSSDPKLYISAQGAQTRPWTGVNNDYNGMNITSLANNQTNSRPTSASKRNGGAGSPSAVNQQQGVAMDRRGRTPTPNNARGTPSKKKRPGSAPATRRFGSNSHGITELQGTLMTAGSPATGNAGGYGQGGPGRQGYGPRLVVKPSAVTQGSPMQPFQYAQTQLRAQHAANMKATKTRPRSRKPSTSSTASTRAASRGRQQRQSTASKHKKKTKAAVSRNKKESSTRSSESGNSGGTGEQEGFETKQQQQGNNNLFSVPRPAVRSEAEDKTHLPSAAYYARTETTNTSETPVKVRYSDVKRHHDASDGPFLPETPKHRNTAAASSLKDDKKGSAILAPKDDGPSKSTASTDNKQGEYVSNKRPVLLSRGTEENAQPLPNASLGSPAAEPANSSEAPKETTTTVRITPSQKVTLDSSSGEGPQTSTAPSKATVTTTHTGNSEVPSQVSNTTSTANRLNRPPSAHPKSRPVQMQRTQDSMNGRSELPEQKVIRVSGRHHESKDEDDKEDSEKAQIQSKYNVGNDEDVLIPIDDDGVGVGVRAPGGFDEQGDKHSTHKKEATPKSHKSNVSGSSSEEESSVRQRVHGEIDTAADDASTAVRQQVRPQTALAATRPEHDRKTAQRPSSAGPSRRTSSNQPTENQSTGGSQDADPKQQQREREWQQRQRLKETVASDDFDGHSTTDFYGFGKVLGQGSFGKVRLAWHRLAGCKVAVKSYEKSKMKEPQHWKRVQQEIKLMERLNHPYVIRMLEMIDSPKRIHIIMEYAGGGNLCSYVKSRKRLSEPESRRIFIQILLATEYMHDNSIIHRDVKLENVLFDHARDMKLVDFGFSVEVKDPNKRLKVFCGTPSYMSPEIVQRKEYLGRPVDVWSLGVLLFACLCGHFPFVAKTYPELYKKIAGGHLRFPDHLSNASRDLLRRMLHPDPMKRLTLGRARRHPWAAPVASAALRAVSMIPDHSLLINEKDPSQDLIEAAIRKCTDMGFRRDVLVQSVISRAKNAYTSTYYLLLHRYGRTALLEHSERLRGKGRKSDDTERPTSATPRSQGHSSGVITGQPTRGRSFQRPSSAKPGSNQGQAEYPDSNYATYRRPYNTQHGQQGRPMSAAPSARRAGGGASYLDRILQNQGNNYAADYL